MKGIIFSEFLDHVDQKFGEKMTDKIIDLADLPSKGAYTSIGTYDYEEMLRLVSLLSSKTGIAASDLWLEYGEHLFGRFVQLYPKFFGQDLDPFSFLETVETHIHVEVRKLYPDAQLPTFRTERPSAKSLVMTYRSSRPFGDLCEGLIRGCIAHCGAKVRFKKEDHSSRTETCIAFTLVRE